MRREFGITSGMRLREWLAFLFDVNDRATKKLSDIDIGLRLVAEFPGSQSAIRYSHPKWIWIFRLQYNRGDIFRTVDIPARPSFRYEDGIIVSRLGIPLSKKAIIGAFKRHQVRWEKQQLEKTKEEVRKRPPRKYKKLGRKKKLGRPKKKRYKKVHKATAKKRQRQGLRRWWKTRKARELQSQMSAKILLT